MNFSKNNKNILILTILIGFISLIIGTYIGEDALGGAKYDYLFHEKYILSFYKDFNEALDVFGNNYEVRNSLFFLCIHLFFLKLG